MVPKVIVGPYDIPSLVFEDVAVATNKCPLGTYRGVGRPSAVFSIERLMDTIAEELGLSAFKVRQANLVREFPHTTAHGLTYDSGTYLETLDLVQKELDWGNRHGKQKGNERYRTGIGLAVFNEQTAHGTPDFEVRGTPIETGYQGVRVEVDQTGRRRSWDSNRTDRAWRPRSPKLPRVSSGSVTIRFASFMETPGTARTASVRGVPVSRLSAEALLPAPAKSSGRRSLR